MRHFICLLLLAVFSSTSHAAMKIEPLDTNDPVGLGTLNKNNFQASFASLFGIDQIFNEGANIRITEAGTLTFYYHGAESGYTNEFVIPDDPVDANSTGYTYAENGPGQGNSVPLPLSTRENSTLIGEYIVGASEVGKSFRDLGIRFKIQGESNSIGKANTKWFGVFFKSGDDIAGDYYELFFGFDDGGAGPDDNHDDMIVRAVFMPSSQSSSVVPEPYSWAIWVGLIGLGFVMHRRNRKAVVA